MLIRIKPSHALTQQDVTSEAHFATRRQVIRGLGTAGLGAGLVAGLVAGMGGVAVSSPSAQASTGDLGTLRNSSFSTSEKQTSYKDITTYNNFYEFGLDKGDPARHAHRLKTRPWTITVDGEVHNPQTIDIDNLIKLAPLEERIYRMRCVEGWSMVIPWSGVPLKALLDKVEPTGKAKFVSFETAAVSGQMPGLRSRVLDWPYREGLRLDEAQHPLTLLAVGLYGKTLLNQNGAPVRLVVPWKYGFKGIKSIVRIRVTERMPKTSWNLSAPQEYGFYANVNPAVDHPRWSQATERRIGDFFRRDTLPFNGYGDDVASLYKGMNLKRFY